MAYLDPVGGPYYAKVQGVTAGQVTASKALIVDSNKDLASLRHLTLTGNLVVGSTTISETDIAKIDGITNGTVAASKAVVVDANLDVGTFRHLTLSGNLVSGATTISETDIAKIDAITNGTAAASKALVLDTNLTVAGQRTRYVSKVASYPVTTGDSGVVFEAGAADLVFTLPATAAGLHYTFVLAAAGLSAGTGLSISPNAADQIIGNGFTPADDKDAICAGSGDRAGDMIELVGDGNLGWYITGVIGTWTRE